MAAAGTAKAAKEAARPPQAGATRLEVKPRYALLERAAMVRGAAQV